MELTQEDIGRIREKIQGRKLQVIYAVGQQGKTEREINEELGISRSSFGRTREQILYWVGANNMTHAVALCKDAGVI